MQTLTSDTPQEQARFEDPLAELEALKCVLYDAPEALGLLSEYPHFAECFNNYTNRAIFRAIQKVVASGKPAVPLTIHAAIEDATVEVDFIVELFKQSQIASPVVEYAKILHEKYLRRSERDEHRRAIHALENGDDDTAAFAAKAALEFAGGIIRGDELPEIEDAATLIDQNLAEPSELVYGLFHIGSKLVLGGSSKSFKTWNLIDLAVSVSHGEPFLSNKTAKGRVLFINFEVQSPFFWKRVKAVAHAKGIKIEKGQLEALNLRGYAADFQSLLPKIERKIKSRRYALVILDPLYKLLGNADENKAGDMAKLMNAIEKLCRETGAAVAFGAHFAKGNASGKESMDRISGSGVFARDPDSILTLTKHEVDDAFVVDCTLRNFKPIQPFVVRWQFPLMRRDDNLDPKSLKQVNGRKAIYSVETILEQIGNDELGAAEWQRRAFTECGMSSGKFYELLRTAKQTKAIQPIGRKWRVTPLTPETPIGAVE